MSQFGKHWMYICVCYLDFNYLEYLSFSYSPCFFNLKQHLSANSVLYIISMFITLTALRFSLMRIPKLTKMSYTDFQIQCLDFQILDSNIPVFRTPIQESHMYKHTADLINSTPKSHFQGHFVFVSMNYRVMCSYSCST